MKLTPNNFLSQIKNLVTGGGIGSYGQPTDKDGTLPDGGFKHDYQYHPQEFSIPAGTYTSSTNSTNFSTSVVLNAGNISVLGGYALQWAHATASGASTEYTVPRDYDVESDYFNIRILGSKAATGSDTPGFSTQAFVLLPGTSTFTAMVQNSNSSTNTYGVNLSAQEFNFSGNGLVRDAIVSLVVTPVGNTTAGQELNLYNLEVVTASCLVAFGDLVSTGGFNQGYNLDNLGNELR